MQTERIIKKILKKSIHHSSFYSEINILKNIKHPNIPIIYDQYEDDEAFYIVEEYIDAPNLMEHIKENGLVSELKAVDIGIKLCEIISFLHCQKPIPILFLDIQPKNILIKEDKIFLVDFGNSYYLNEAGKRNLLLGTPGYAAPEQYKYQKLDERTDIYGIGAVLYFMVTGRSSNRKNASSLEFPNEVTRK
jgi:serine/threonine-protein kinase